MIKRKKMNVNEKAEQYAREVWGVYYNDMHPDCAIINTIGEISAKDFIAGYNEAKRWIPVGEQIPMCYESGNWDGLKSDKILVKLKGGCYETAYCYSGILDGCKFFDFYDSRDFEIKDVTEWREI